MPRVGLRVGMMDGLESRQLYSWTRICRKLLRGDVLPFWFEVMQSARDRK